MAFTEINEFVQPNQREVETHSSPRYVHTYDDFILVLSEQLEIPRVELLGNGRSGDVNERGFLDYVLVNDPRELTHLARWKVEGAQDVVLQISGDLSLTRLNGRVPTYFEISARENFIPDSERIANLRQQFKGETWLDFQEFRQLAAADLI